MIALFVSFAACSLYIQHEEKSFISWMRSTNNFYTGDDYFLRLGIFMTNARFVKEHNAAHKSFKVGLNQFSAYTPAEYKSLQGLKFKNLNMQKVTKSIKKANLDSLDWREQGVINTISDQGNCAAGYAFAAIQAVEAANAIKTGTLLKLSEQEQIDCNNWCGGCNGGLISDVFLFTYNFLNKTFCLESDYPYAASVGKCLFEEKPHAGALSDYENVMHFDEDDLEAKLQTGPVGSMIDATPVTFQLYSGGIFDDEVCSETVLTHGVCVVGFGSENGVKYWIVRNSYGAQWGEDGYIRMIRKNNQCGIASMAAIPYA